MTRSICFHPQGFAKVTIHRRLGPKARHVDGHFGHRLVRFGLASAVFCSAIRSEHSPILNIYEKARTVKDPYRYRVMR